MISTVEELLTCLRADPYRRLHWNILEFGDHAYQVFRLGDMNPEEVAYRAGRDGIASGLLLETEAYVYKYNFSAEQFDYK